MHASSIAALAKIAARMRLARRLESRIDRLTLPLRCLDVDIGTTLGSRASRLKKVVMVQNGQFMAEPPCR